MRRARTREALPEFVEALVEPSSLTDWRTGLRRINEGRAVWTDAGGCRACTVPIWLDDAPTCCLPGERRY